MGLRAYTRYPRYREFTRLVQPAADAHFGPASWPSKLLALLSAIFVKPVIALLTVIGMIVNRFRPAVLQRAPHRPSAAHRVAVGGHRGHAIVCFHGSALITLGLNSHRRA